MNLNARSWALAASLVIHFLFVVGLSLLPSRSDHTDTPIEVIDLTHLKTSQKSLHALKAFATKKNSVLPPDNPNDELSGRESVNEDSNLKSDHETSDSGLANESLLTTSVKVLREVKIDYPQDARKNNIDGVVVMDLVIDQAGKVRSAELIRGPGFGLNEAALAAIKDFLFRPARIGEKAVAVKIRYSYRFKLNAQ